MNKRIRVLIFLLPLVAFIALAVLLFNRNGEDPSLLPSARIGQNLPSFEVVSLTEPGRVLTPDDLKGEVSLLNVWATWCVSCLIEHPVLMELAESGIPIYGVNYKDIPESALMYLANNGDPFRFSMSDVSGSLGLDLGVYGAPETYLLDREGRIRYRSVGVLDARSWIDELEPRYRALVAEETP
jgi:cytochrome c biogenesis protein CcmG/thiol:disulfide interchange protein DsbE